MILQLRVSGIMSNAPYLLVLDCDMYCNDPLSAKQAMCFHLDHEISSSLSYVQFPQIFYNVSKNDIYDGQARSAYKVYTQSSTNHLYSYLSFSQDCFMVGIIICEVSYTFRLSIKVWME